MPGGLFLVRFCFGLYLAGAWRRPRTGRVGRVIRDTTVCLDSTSALRVGTAKPPVPMTMSRMLLSVVHTRPVNNISAPDWQVVA